MITFPGALEDALIIGETGIPFMTFNSNFAGIDIIEANVSMVNMYPAYFAELADAESDFAGYGQLWVHNVTPCELMYTDDAGTDFNITPAYFFAYRTTSFDLANNNTWYDYPWNVAAVNKVGFTHDHAGANPEHITFNRAGTYEITYQAQLYMESTGYNYVGHALNGGTEIPGSACGSTNIADKMGQLIRTFQATFAAGDILHIQFGTNSGGDDIVYFDSSALPDATTFVSAIISIKRIG